MSDVQIAFEKAWDAVHSPSEGVPQICEDLDWLALAIHGRNQHFYHDIHTGEKLDRNAGELIALMHSELSEMLEGIRKSLKDTHLPEYTSEEVELADLLIRAFDYAGYRKLRLGEALWAKLEYNRTRQDHTAEARRETHGKKF